MEGGAIERARRGYEAFNREGIEVVMERFHPEMEVRMWETFSRDTRVYRGHEGVREVMRILAENYEDFTAEPLGFEVRAGALIVPVRLHGRGKGNGHDFEMEVVQVWRGDGERATRLDAFPGMEEALLAVQPLSG